MFIINLLIVVIVCVFRNLYFGVGGDRNIFGLVVVWKMFFDSLLLMRFFFMLLFGVLRIVNVVNNLILSVRFFIGGVLLVVIVFLMVFIVDMDNLVINLYIVVVVDVLYVVFVSFFV